MEQESVFINGRAQIIEMLKYMNGDEKSTLLKNIAIKNPQLAEELSQNSLSLKHITNLKQHDVGLICQYVKAPIMGMALKNLDQKQQRSLLSMAPRNYAEEAYKIMITAFANESKDMKRAEGKVLEVISQLSRRGQINL